MEAETSRAEARKPRVGRPRRSSRKVDGGQPETRERILAIATEEFSAKGFDGARIDEIMHRSKVSKNLIYHYFGSKDKLFVAVLESAYARMHEAQRAWIQDVSTPAESLRKLIQIIFNHWKDSPEFIGLLSSENFQKGRHIKKTKVVHEGYEAVLNNLQAILAEGERLGEFRPGISATELYVSISSLAYHLFSNRYTLSILLDREYNSARAQRGRLDHIEEMVLRYVMDDAAMTKAGPAL